jgi:spermidine synthase
VLYRLDRPAAALRIFDLALQQMPDYWPARRGRVQALRALGREQEARSELERFAASTAPLAGRREALVGLAHLYWQAGRDADAVASLRDALAAQLVGDDPLAPGAISAANALAWMLATSADSDVRDGEAALFAIDRALASAEADDAALLDTRAAALAALGRFEDAASLVERAAMLARDDARLSRNLERRMALYRSGRAYRRVSPAEDSP